MEKSAEKLSEFQKELNIISPDEKTNVLAANLLQLNTEYTNSEADRFKKEAAAKSVANGSIEALEASGTGRTDSPSGRSDTGSEPEVRHRKNQFRDQSPEYKKAANEQAELQAQFVRLKAEWRNAFRWSIQQAVNREEMLKKAVDQTKADFESLNLKTFEYTNLKRKADADRTLYEDLSRKIKEAGINAGFQNSSIRLADPASRH